MTTRLDRTVSRAAPAAARSRELAEVLATRRDLRAAQLGVSGPTANLSGSGGDGALGVRLLLLLRTHIVQLLYCHSNQRGVKCVRE